jgi:hypothetical protein
MKKFNFASTLTNNTTYDGEQLESYILKAFTKSKFVESLPATQIISDIVFKQKIGKIDGSNLVQTGSTCSFTDTGAVTVSEETLTPAPYWINLQMCYEDLEPIFNSLNSGALNQEELSAEFAKALTDLMVSKMNYATQEAYINKIDGQIVTNVYTGATGLTKSNIIEALSNLVQEVPEDVLEADDLTIYMNRKTLQLYFDALAALASLTPQDSLTPNYMGIPIVTVPTIAANTMYCLQKTNIFVGVGAMDEFSSVQIIDMRPLGQGNNVRLILQGKCDCSLGWEAEAAKWYYV